MTESTAGSGCRRSRGNEERKNDEMHARLEVVNGAANERNAREYGRARGQHPLNEWHKALLLLLLLAVLSSDSSFVSVEHLQAAGVCCGRRRSLSDFPTSACLCARGGCSDSEGWSPGMPVMGLRGGGRGGETAGRGWAAVEGVSKGKSGGTKSSSRNDVRGKARRVGSSEEEEEEEDFGEKNVPLGKHLMPVLRPKKSETVAPAAAVISMSEAIAHKRERERARSSNTPDAGSGLVYVTVDERRTGGGVLPMTPQELRKLSKGALLKMAKQSGLKVVCEDKSLLSNRDVRKALEPFLPSGEALKDLERERSGVKSTPVRRKKGQLAEKSKYLSSVWVDGQEKSVYGEGHPKDSDFVAWAVECVEELEERERLTPSGRTRSKKERAELIHETALKFSDQFFAMVCVRVHRGRACARNAYTKQLRKFHAYIHTHTHTHIHTYTHT